MSVVDRIDSDEICLAIGTRSGLAVSPQKELREELLSLARIGEKMRWVPVSERLPENKSKWSFTVVLCTDGKSVYKAYYVKHHEINSEDMNYEGDSDYDEATDSYYWPEGWYECSSENEETDWALGAIITHWMPLPEPPSTGV